MIFSFKSAVIKELIPIGCGEKFASPECCISTLKVFFFYCFLFLVMQKVLEKECTWTHNKKKQPNTWNALDESLKQTFRNFSPPWWNCTELRLHTLKKLER